MKKKSLKIQGQKNGAIFELCYVYKLLKPVKTVKTC